MQPASRQRLAEALIPIVRKAGERKNLSLSRRRIDQADRGTSVLGQVLVEATGGLALRSDGAHFQEDQREAVRIDDVIAASTPQLATQIINAA